MYKYGEAGKRKLKKIIVTVATITVVGFGSAFFSDSVQADTINDLQNKQAEIADERSDIKKNLSKAEAEIADVLLDLKELNEEIVQVEEALEHNQKMLDETEEEIETLEKEIDKLEAEIIELEENIKLRSDILKQRITSYQKSGGNIGFLDVLFGAKNFGEFISRVSAVTKITNSDNELIKQQEEDKAQVEEIQQNLEVKLDEQNDMRIELKGMEELILDQKKQNEKSKKELKKKEKELKKMKSELETKDSNLASLESQIRRDIAAARNPVTRSSHANTGASSTSSNSNADQLTTVSSEKPISGSGSISTVINAGYKYYGVPYRTAGKTPAGFDCSGFVSWAYGQAGYNIPSSTAGLRNTGTKVSYSEIQPGDLVFFDTYKKDGHVGIYIGNGKFIGSQNTNGLSEASVHDPYYWGKKFKGHVRRIR